MQQVRQALDQAERALAEGRSPVPVVGANPETGMPDAESAPEIVAPQLYFPTFYVASIVYRGPNDWMLWINDQRVTPKRPFVGVKVASVVKDRVTLSWEPDNWDYREPIWRAKVKPSEAILRLKSRDGSTHLDKKKKTLSATLKSNQTFVTSVPMVAEGRQMNLAASVQAGPASATGDNKVSSENAARSIQETLKRLAQQKTDTHVNKISGREGRGKNSIPAMNQKNNFPPRTNNAPNPGGQNNAGNPLPPSLNDVLNAASRASQTQN
jgi:hypothetical protein